MSRLVPAPEQIAATDPASSNWVGANAGSGKTHVLTQRVARLLLEGAPPQRILCLTYTKAAASEMQSRLFRTLGRWAMAPAAELGGTLGDLSGAGQPVTDPARLADARRLFARALETPGGLKIQTIHAFCTEVLRRFPLEAGVSPRFEVADDRRSGALLAEVREAMAEAAADAFDCAARVLNEDDIDALAGAVLRRRASFADEIENRIAAHFGTSARLSETEIAADALNRLDLPTLQALGRVLLDKGGRFDGPVGEALATPQPQPDAAVDRLIRRVLTQKMEARSPRGFPGAEVKRARPQAEDELRRLTDWALDTRARLCTARMAARVRDLNRFALALLERHDDAKARTALLDFDDLVERSRRLMTDGAMRGWVLWKLDQGIDHILVDEAQDTAPVQWEVVAAIADEFFAGAGARPQGRSIFVVGDEKQSIYSFQGAEPHAFGRMRGHFGDRLDAVGRPLGRPDLLTSYRSAPAILQFVDAVFQGPAGEGLTVSDEAVRHVAHRQGAHGRVDLWPRIDPEPPAEPLPWFRPVDEVPASDTRERLAATVAERIATMIAEDWLGPRPPDRPARRVRPGDILVLVSRRDRLAAGIIRELKARDVPVAGADRMLLTAEIAVQDLLALARVACLPGDDLSLAALLRSPLCDVDEDALFDLAHGRDGTLWHAMQMSERHSETAAFLRDMAAQADFLRPYEFFERALIRHDGRRRLLARLGPEAEDAIDELLSQALAYESAEAPSLTDFVAWIEADEITVKREMEAGNVVRVMTVHGAKGLEAPIVILPDTISGGRPGGGGPLLLSAAAGGTLPALTLWAGAKGDDDAVSARARAEAEAREKAERRRLLYVALTRAEDWLILCGAGLRNAPRDTWYEMLEDGLGRLPCTTLPSPTGTGEMRRFETGPAPQPLPGHVAAPPAPEPELPAWTVPAMHEPRRPRPSPSALAPAVAHGGAGVGRALAMALGTAVHRLLERLPDHPAGRHAALADRLLAHEFPALAPEHRAAAWDEAARVLALPGFADLFGPDSLAEVAAAIPGPGGVRMTGRIDRLLVCPDAVLIVDFKTDRAPPADPAQVPAAYMAQLGAYRAALAAAFPGRAVSAALLWTAGPRLMRLDTGAVELAFRESLAAA